MRGGVAGRTGSSDRCARVRVSGWRGARQVSSVRTGPLASSTARATTGHSWTDGALGAARDLHSRHETAPDETEAESWHGSWVHQNTAKERDTDEPERESTSVEADEN